MPPQITPGRELTVTPPRAPCPITVRLEFFASDAGESTVDVIYRIVDENVKVRFEEPQGPSLVHRKAGVALSGLAQRVVESGGLVDTGITVFPTPVRIRASLVAAGAADDSAPLASTATRFFAQQGGG